MTRETRAVAGAGVMAVFVALSVAAVAQRPEAPPGARAGPGTGRAALVVDITDVEHPDGSAGVALWRTAQGFPEEVEHAIRAVYVPVAAGVASTLFDGLEPGTYAVTVFNDRDGNEAFDKNWLGMPREPWGVSNGARPRLRAPRFDEAAFELPAGATTIAIELR